MAKEFIYRIGSVDTRINRPPRFYRSNTLSGLNLRFASVYAVRASDAAYIEEAGTAAQFKGIVWSQKLWIDLDTEEASRGAISRLKELKYAFSVYTTGNRGCHIGVTRTSRPSHLLPAQDKQWVKANIPGADLSLYWHLHLIRLPGTVHEETGKPKQLILEAPGQALELLKYNPEEATEAEPPKTSSMGRQSIFSIWEVVSNLTGGDVGNRHQQLLTLAGALKNDAHVTIDEAMWVCKEVNSGFSEPKTEHEVERIVLWIYQ